jgi:IS5 family transposase
MNSFFGHFLYQQKVPRDHFLNKLNEVVDWSRFTKRLLGYYEGKGERGQAPYNPALILKMLLLSYLYNISERQVEILANDSLSVGCFLGLGADEKAPDHSTLTLFKNRLLKQGGKGAYEGLFNEIIIMAKERGVKFGPIQVVDSVHVVADVNLRKDKTRQKKGEEPRDPDAGWGAKGGKIEEGKEGPQKKVEYFYGYKDQVSLNAETELVTSVIAGLGKEYDGHWLRELVEQDKAKGVTPMVVTADKGYDDGENHLYLQELGICSAIRLNRYRTEKKDKNREVWVRLKGSKGYQEGLKERYKIERKFGEAKKWHGFGRCRYVGFLRHAVQAYLTFMAVNLKRLVKLVTGVSFRVEPGPVLRSS